MALNRRYVYVIELDPTVWLRPAFREANPHVTRGVATAVYVGSSSCTPPERFLQHREGYKASRWVKRYGKRLLPSLYKAMNPVDADDAERVDRLLARELRADGYAVWQR